MAWRYISFYRSRTVLLVAALSLTLFLPLVAQWMTHQFSQHAVSRASQTPLIVGAKGSRFGLAIHGLYFRGEAPQSITQSQVTAIEETQLAKTIPILSKFRARGFPIVGTTRDYLHLRELEIGQGESWSRLGDCVLGARVAEELGLGIGERLLSEPENLFDLSGPAPLNMRITGILRISGTADDEAVFCDVQTTWIIQGIGHGHNLKAPLLVDSDDHVHEANRGALAQYNEVTDENIKSFHFHGRRSLYPLTAIIAIPDSEKSEAILIGKYLSPDETHQIIRPIEVVGELMEVMSRVKKLFDYGILLVGFATLLLVTLVMLLSIRLRAREMRTLTLLGCSRFMTMRVIATELTIVLGASVLIAWSFALITVRWSDYILTRLL